jgi:hypothetical protein
MIRAATILGAAGICFWMQVANVARAQSPNADRYVANPAMTSTVSPYVSLGVDANGYSNYQTLIRPMLRQREATARQPLPSDPARRSASRMARAARVDQSLAPGARSLKASERFLNYSHYFMR